MKPRSLAVLGLLLYCTATWAQNPAPKPWKPGSRTPTPPATQQTPATKKKTPNLIQGVPDTGQFLPDSALLGRIDERRFTVREFRDRWYASFPLDRPKTDSTGRWEFLNNMVNKEVLAGLAWKVNRPLTFEDRQQLREVRQQWLANAAFARLVGDSAQPTEAEIQHVYAQRQIGLHLQHILTPDAPTAERARSDVLAKRLTWPEAVKRYSISRSDKGPDGDVGWVQRKSFPLLTAIEVYDLQDGQLSRPFEGDSGWEVVRVVEHRAEKIPGLDQLRLLIVDEARGAKVIRRMEEVRAGVRQRIGMVYDSTNIVWAAAVFARDERQQAAASQPGTVDLSGLLPEIAPADTPRVLARWNGGHYTLGQFLEEFNAVPFPQRGKVGTFSAFRSRLDGFALQPFMAELALERGLDQDPLVLRGVRMKEEELRVEHLFGDSVQTRVAVTTPMRQKFFKEHASEFRSWENVTYAIILRHTKAGADSVETQLKAGTDPAAVIRSDSLAGFASGSIKSLREDEHDSLHKLLYEELRAGQTTVVGPDKAGDYAVLKVLAHDYGRQMAFAEVENLVDESLQNSEAERLLKQFIAHHRAGHRIELHPERLMLVKLTDPTLD